MLFQRELRHFAVIRNTAAAADTISKNLTSESVKAYYIAKIAKESAVMLYLTHIKEGSSTYPKLCVTRLSPLESY